MPAHGKVVGSGGDRELRGVYRKPVFCSRSYCIITCGGAPLTVLKHYVEQQATPE
jgi:putative transposase